MKMFFLNYVRKPSSVYLTYDAAFDSLEKATRRNES